LVELGLVLLLVSVIMNALARYLIYRVSRKQTGKSRLSRLFRLPAAAVRPSATAVSLPPTGGKPSPARRLFVSAADKIMTIVLGACLAFTAGILIVILGYITVNGVRAINWSFFVNLPAPVGRTGGGLANAIVGSAMLVGVATVMAIPIGLLAAVYVAEFRSDRLGPAVRFVGELLGGVPSIVIGIFAYTVVVLPMGHFSGWAGSIALAVMMVPIILRASEEALKIVPQSLRHGSYALGASHWQTVVHVVIPTALPSIITAVFLAIARVAGETAPLLLTASSNQFWPRSPNDFMPSLPVYIFTYATGPYPDWHRQAWAAALVLLTVVMLLNCGVRIASRRKAVGDGRAE
jgi:phosphate transport system permease protein